MRIFTWIALLGFAGCGDANNDPDARELPPDASIDAPAQLGPQIRATITVSSAGPGDVVCQQNHPTRGTDGIRIHARHVGSPDAGFLDVFPCDATELLTPPLTTGPGEYDVWVDYIADRNRTDPDAWVVLATTTPTRVQVPAGEALISASLVLDNGFFEANWRVVDNAGTNLTCAQVPGEDGVSLLATLTTNGSAVEDIFNCEDGIGSGPRVITAPIPLGSYVVVAALLDSTGGSIGDSTPITTSIVDGNEYRDLGVVRIRVP